MKKDIAEKLYRIYSTSSHDSTFWKALANLPVRDREIADMIALCMKIEKLIDEYFIYISKTFPDDKYDKVFYLKAKRMLTNIVDMIRNKDEAGLKEYLYYRNRFFIRVFTTITKIKLPANQKGINKAIEDYCRPADRTFTL